MVHQVAQTQTAQVVRGQHQQVSVSGDQTSVSLAMQPTLTNNNNNNNNLNQPQYSPQASLYQQQLIKSAQQFANHHQQQVSRLNGTNPLHAIQFAAHHQQQQAQQQHNSPQQNGITATQYATQYPQHQPQADPNLYGNNARHAPVYAPKPTFYGQVAAGATGVGAPQLAQQVQAQQQQQQQQSQAMYQTARQHLQAASYFQQPQHSPASQISQNQIVQQQPLAAMRHQQQQQQQRLSPGDQNVNNNASMPLVVSQAPVLTPIQLEQQQRQMQQLVLSYQNEQQFQQDARTQLSAVQHLGAAPIVTEWPSTHDTGDIMSDSNRNASTSRRPNVGRAAFSDRDSVSTISRFNQFDERRSFTMRSQYTSGAQSKANKRFGFVELTGEALKRLLGVGTTSGTSSHRRPLLVDATGEQMRRNCALATTSNKPSAGPQVTALDSGDEYYFKRQVFKYQLVILRLVNVLLSAFVLMSPVVMLLLPKLEPLLRDSAAPEQLVGEYNSLDGHQAAPQNAVTHAIGLSANSKHLSRQQVSGSPQWRIAECQSSDCDGPLIGFVVRLAVLAAAHWAIFFRAQTVTLPRVDMHRCLLISLALLVTFAYWLFFLFRVFDKRHNDFELQYMTIVQFAISLLEALVVLHYFALVLVELRHRKKCFCIKIVRSPDGMAKYFTCGALSIQKCAQFVLEKYQCEFSSYTSYTEQMLAQEEELARQLKQQRRRQHNQPNGASRAGSPSAAGRRGGANTDDDDDADERASTRDHRDGRRSSRRHHRQRSQHSRHNSATASSGQDRHVDEDETERDANEHENNAARRHHSRKRRASRRAGERTRASSCSSSADEEQNKEGGENKCDKEQAEVGAKLNSESAGELSSDAASRLKGSSLETVRAASSSTGAQSAGNLSANAPNADIEISKRPSFERNHRDELESVRSARSRRSTGSRMTSSREHQRRHRERSSSRTARQSDRRLDERHESGDSAENNTTSARQQAAATQNELDEHERKLRRRKLRLLAQVEETFQQVKLIGEGGHQIGPDELAGQATNRLPPQNGLDAGQAARSMYPSIARSLQKYLRLTKQTSRHNLASIYEHLAKCLLYKLSARTFLEKFTNLDPVWQSSETNLFANCRIASLSGQLATSGSKARNEFDINSWSLVCDTLLSRQIDAGTFFVLEQGGVSLLVSVARMPHLNLTEQVLDESACKFAFQPKPETSCV